MEERKELRQIPDGIYDTEQGKLIIEGTEGAAYTLTLQDKRGNSMCVVLPSRIRLWIEKQAEAPRAE